MSNGVWSSHARKKMIIFRPALSLQMFLLERQIETKYRSLGSCRRANTKNLTRYLWKMSSPPRTEFSGPRPSRPPTSSAQASALLNHLGDKNGAESLRKTSRGEGHREIESEASCTASGRHLSPRGPRAQSAS